MRLILCLLFILVDKISTRGEKEVINRLFSITAYEQPPLIKCWTFFFFLVRVKIKQKRNKKKKPCAKIKLQRSSFFLWVWALFYLRGGIKEKVRIMIIVIEKYLKYALRILKDMVRMNVTGNLNNNKKTTITAVEQ